MRHLTPITHLRDCCARAVATACEAQAAQISRIQLELDTNQDAVTRAQLALALDLLKGVAKTRKGNEHSWPEEQELWRAVRAFIAGAGK